MLNQENLKENFIARFFFFLDTRLNIPLVGQLKTLHVCIWSATDGQWSPALLSDPWYHSVRRWLMLLFGWVFDTGLFSLSSTKHRDPALADLEEGPGDGALEHHPAAWRRLCHGQGLWGEPTADAMWHHPAQRGWILSVCHLVFSFGFGKLVSMEPQHSKDIFLNSKWQQYTADNWGGNNSLQIACCETLWGRVLRED